MSEIRAVRPLGEVEPTGGGVEGGEELVLDEHAGVGESVEQARLAGVGVADQGDGGDPAAAARLAAGVPAGLHLLQVLLQGGDPFQ